MYLRSDDKRLVRKWRLRRIRKDVARLPLTVSVIGPRLDPYDGPYRRLLAREAVLV